MEQPTAATAADTEGSGDVLASLETLISSRGASEAPAVEIASLHFAAAQIYLGQTDQSSRGRAIEHLQAGWQLQPQDMDLRLVLARCLEEDDRLCELAELYQRSAEHCDDTHEQNALLSRAAEIYQCRGDPEEALRVFRRMADYGGHRVVEERVRALRALLEDLEPRRTDLRIEGLTLLLEHLRGSERFDCAMALAEAQRLGGDEEAAYVACQQALVLRPDAPGALEPALAHLEARGQLGDMVRLLSSAVQSSEESLSRASLLRRLARLFEERLADLSQAVELWWHAWDEAETGEELPALKRLCGTLEHWDGYHEVLRQESQRARNPGAKLDALRELATFQREVLHDDRAAAETYGFILQLQPDDTAALTSRLEIFEKEGSDRAATALRRLAAGTRDPAERSRLLRRLARLEMRRDRRGNLLGALGQLDPSCAEDRALVGELRGKLDLESERPLMVETGLLELRLARQASDGPAAWLDMAIELCRFCLRAGEPGNAADCLRQVLEVDPGNAAALEIRAGLGPRDAGSDPSLDDLAGRAQRLVTEQPLAAVRLLIQAAEVARDRLPAEAGQAWAADRLRQAATVCPLDADAELLALEEALRTDGLDDDLAQLLRRRIESETRPQARKALLLALAQLLRDRLHDPERAVVVLEEALSLDPRDIEVAQEIRSLHTELHHHAALAKMLEELATGIAGRSRVPLLEELGRLYAGELQDPALALNRYGELLALCPNHQKALEFCQHHDERAGDFRSVAVLLCRAAEAADEPLEAAEIHRRIALIAEEKLEDLDFAIAQWRRVVELCAADSAPRSELRRLLGQAGRWGELETLLLSDVSRAGRPEDRVPLLLKLATIAREHQDDQRRAVGYLRLAQQIAPANRELMTQLETVHERLGQWRELGATLRRHAELEADLGEKVKLLHRAARVLQVRLKRDDEALEVCRQIRQLQPADRVSVTLMSEVYGRRAEWAEKVALLREQVSLERDPTELSRLHLELGHLAAERLGDGQAATSHFERAMELDAGRGEVLPALRRFYEGQGHWDQLVDLIRRRASTDTLSARERAAALCEVGRIRELHQNDPEAARDAYERALHLDPSCEPAVSGLRALATDRGQWREVVSLGRRQLELCTDVAARSAILMEIGEVLHEKLDRGSAASEALEELLANDPGNVQAAARLGTISFEAGDWDQAARLLRQVAESGVEVKDLHECYYRLGFAAEKLGDEDEAFSFYVKSFGLEPMYLPTLDRLFDLCYVRRQWDNTLRIANAVVGTYQGSKTPEELAELHLRIGLCELQLAERDIAVTKLQDLVLEPGEVPGTPDEAWQDAAECWAATALNPHLLGRLSQEVMGRAVRAMDRALGQRSDHPGALQVLAALSLGIGDWENTLRTIERIVDGGALTPRRLAMHLCCAGELAQHHLRSPQRAGAYFRRAISLDPSYGRAKQRLAGLEGDSAAANGQEPTIRMAPPPIPATLRHSRSQPLAHSRVMPPLPPGAQAPFRPTPRSKPRKPGGEE